MLFGVAVASFGAASSVSYMTDMTVLKLLIHAYKAARLLVQILITGPRFMYGFHATLTVEKMSHVVMPQVNTKP